MKWYRIRALAMRNIKLTFKGFIDPVCDFIYWPLLDIVVWGFTSRWISSYNNDPQVSLSLLTGLVLWQASYRANLDISLNLLSELWFRNVVNLFSTPLTLGEWISGSMLLGLCNASIAVTVGGTALWFLYGVNILSLGWALLPFFMLLLLSGWVIGFTTAAFLVFGGQKVQKLVWVMGWFFVPFSAVYYPLDILPQWAQTVASALPMSYVFSGLRTYIQTGIFPLKSLIISLVLVLSYLLLALLFFKYMFEKSRTKGFARLENE